METIKISPLLSLCSVTCRVRARDALMSYTHTARVQINANHPKQTMDFSISCLSLTHTHTNSPALHWYRLLTLSLPSPAGLTTGLPPSYLPLLPPLPSSSIAVIPSGGAERDGDSIPLNARMRRASGGGGGSSNSRRHSRQHGRMRRRQGEQPALPWKH